MEKEQFESLTETLIVFADFEQASPDENGMWPDYVEFEDNWARVWSEFYNGQNYSQGSLLHGYDLSELTDEQMAALRQKLPPELASDVEEARGQ